MLVLSNLFVNAHIEFILSAYRLEKLNIAGNHLKRLRRGELGPSLVDLNLSGNPLFGTRDIAALAGLPKFVSACVYVESLFMLTPS
jgi:hypothetical protein